MPWRGIDVSSWQREVAWPAVAQAGLAFAIAKASEGTGYRDPMFARNWSGIPDAGLVRGAYHYARPDLGNRPEAEAAWFCRVVDEAGGARPGDLLALDLEVSMTGTDRPDLAAWAVAWLEAVESRTSIRPLFYTYASYVRAARLDVSPAASRLGQYPLWLAAYRPDPPTVPGPWQHAGPAGGIAIWQYTSSLSVPGVSGPCDGDLAYVPVWLPDAWQASQQQAPHWPEPSETPEALSDQEIVERLSQAGVSVNPDTAIIRRAILAYWRGEWRGPAISDEYPATAPDGRPVVRQRFTAGIAEYDPTDGEVRWVEIVPPVLEARNLLEAELARRTIRRRVVREALRRLAAL